MPYADYQYYIDNYLLGKEAVIPTASFAFYAKGATRLIDSTTNNQATDTESVKQCCCELAELAYNADVAKSYPQSEKVGDYAVTYSPQSAVEYAADVGRVLRKWLGNTGFLYCGVG